MAFNVLAEALARVEHKLDLILTAIKYSESPQKMPMNFLGHSCPVCDQIVEYQIDLTNNVVTRRCKCTTGKVPPTTPLFPAVQPGAMNGNPTDPINPRSEGEGDAPYRRRR